jgi:hypothetical protein
VIAGDRAPFQVRVPEIAARAVDCWGFGAIRTRLAGGPELSSPASHIDRPARRAHPDARAAAPARGAVAGVYVSRPKQDEEFAQRDLAASETVGVILGQLAWQAGGGEVAR